MNRVINHAEERKNMAMDLESVITNSLTGIEGRDEGTETAPEGDNTPEGEETPIEEGEVAPEGAEEVVEGEESGEAEGKEGEEAPVVEGEGDPVEDAFAKEHGLPQPKKGQRENRIPYSRVQKITGNAVEKAVSTLKTAHTAEIAERDTVIAANTARFKEIDNVETIMAEDPERFMAMLASVYPAYAELTGKKAAAGEADISADMPKPEVDLGEGRMTYGVEGLQKLLEWNTAKVIKETETRLGKRFEPIEKERKDRQTQEQIAAHEAKIIPRINAALEDARTNWEGFKENEAEILAAMKENRLANEKKGELPSLSFEGAYIKVVGPKNKANRDKIRKEVLAEIKKAPISTGIKSSTPVSKKAAADENKPNPGGLEAVIKASLANLPGR